MHPGMEYARSWLCPEPGDRERLLDMDKRLRKARLIAMCFLAVALVASAPWVGWTPVLLLVGLGVVWRLLEPLVANSSKPEWTMAGGWVLSVLVLGAGVVLTGGAHSPATSWVLVPALALPARFTRRGLHAGIVILIVALAVVTIGVDPNEVADEPQLFLFPAALVLAAVAMSMALRSAEIEHRSEAVIDQLTGMLNRKALESRKVELEQQARVSGQPVGLIVCDIDNFKGVNDTHGHTAGDAVLKDVAYRIRKELRAYDLAYRLGGEEFVVLVPGAKLDWTVVLAERLREATRATPIEGISVTASFGCAASRDGLDFRELFEQADEALYRAKAGGRDRVCTPASPAFAALV